MFRSRSNLCFVGRNESLGSPSFLVGSIGSADKAERRVFEKHFNRESYREFTLSIKILRAEYSTFPSRARKSASKQEVTFLFFSF